MKVVHQDADLERLERDKTFTGRFDAAVVKSFRMKMQFIRSAKDERDLYQWGSLRFKKLEGDRQHQRSIRLNDQWRLIVEVQKDENGNTLVVVSIDDYHH